VVVAVTHDLKYSRFKISDRVIVLAHGRVACRWASAIEAQSLNAELIEPKDRSVAQTPSRAT